MRDYKLLELEYLDYLRYLQKEIYKTLPLYERCIDQEHKLDNLINYLDKTIRKIIVTKEIINPLPHSEWYVDVLSNLLVVEKSLKDDTHSHGEIRKYTLDSTNSIKFQIKSLEELFTKGE